MMTVMKTPATVRRTLGLVLMLLVVGSFAAAQIPVHVPSKERVDETAKRRTEIDGNNVRASIFNYLFAGRLGVGQGVAFEWPKNTKREYIALVALFIGGEVIDENGNKIHIVDLPSYRSSPAGKNWNMLPIPGYFNASRPGGGIIAKSDDPTSWPDVWPDKLADKVDPGWKGAWNGFYGKDQFSADQEMFYRVGDDNYNRFSYNPDTTDRARRGLGMIVDTRVMQWSQISVQDATFFIHEFKNDGTKDILKMGTTIWLADLVGGDGDTQDDMPDFDLREAVAFSLDKDGVSSNPAYQGAFVGAVATSFMETPGNAVDRIDNDGDSPENPQTGGGPPVTREMLVGEVPGDGIDNNGNGLVDEDTTFIAFGTQKAVTFADGIDNNGDGEDLSPVVTAQMIADAAADKWHRWPPNPETDPMQLSKDGKNSIIHLINVVSGTLGQKYKDNIDNNNNSNGYNNLPRITQAMINQAASDKYHRYRVPGTDVILYSLGQESLGKKYLNLDGLRDAGVDEKIDEMIDESREDGVDNNTDWNPLTDDVGLDGKAGTHDFGEGDGIPTSGAGTPFPGEPHIDKTDVKEADMIGVTNVQYNRAGAINFGTTADVYYWSEFMTPGRFVDPAVLKQVIGTNGGDFDLFVSSGYFPLKAGQTERVSYSVVMGNAIQKGDADQTGSKADAIRKRRVAQLAYNENYQFSTVPLEPHVTAVTGDHRVTLYWDDVAERTIDRFLAGIPGASGATFEGYRIYRSTDPAFQDASLITDAYGNPAPFKKPIAQYDLRDGIRGFSPIPYNGVLFDLGSDTGLQHTFVDSTVQNGQKYYYAVRAYTKGYTPLEIAPSESNMRISIDNTTGKVKETGPSVAIVIPNAPVGGYVKANGATVTLAQGTTSGLVGYTITDPRYIRDAKYRVTFEDTVLAGGATAVDTFRTTRMTLANITNASVIDTLIRNTTTISDTIEQPVVDGFRLTLTNEKTIAFNASRSGWSKPGRMSIKFIPWDFSPLPASFPNDYKIVFGHVGIDTSVTWTVTTAGDVMPAIPVNFTVIDTYHNRKVPFAFVELEPALGPGIFSAVYDPDREAGSRSDVIVLLEKSARDSTMMTWAFSVLFDSSKSIPTTGDTATIVTTKPFRKGSVFEFTMQAQKVNTELAKQDLERIKVVPNPYVAAATWEERNPFNTGRGPRAIHFNHLPQQCTIRIYTVSGELVQTITHNSTMLNGSEDWNLLTRDNLAVSYGVYIFHVDAPGIGEKIGKFAIIK